MPTRHQKGYVYKKKNRWYVRYYEYIIQEDGSIKRKQMARSETWPDDSLGLRGLKNIRAFR